MPQSRDTMFLSLNPLSGRNERESASADKKTAKTSETSIADKHVDGSWSNSLSPLKLAAAAFAGIGAYAALAPHLQDKGEGLMHLEHGIECIIDGLTGYRTALAKRKSGDSSGGHLPPSKKIITEEERDAVATQGTQRSASLPVEKTAVEEQRSTSLKGTQEEGNLSSVTLLKSSTLPPRPRKTPIDLSKSSTSLTLMKQWPARNLCHLTVMELDSLRRR